MNLILSSKMLLCNTTEWMHQLSSSELLGEKYESQQHKNANATVFNKS